MAFGLTPARGHWLTERSTTSSLVTFLKGCIVSLGPDRTLREYSSTHSSAFGIALNDSVNSLPAGIVEVAIPTPGCTAIADLPTGIAASNLSVGQVGTFFKSGNYNSFFTTTGAFSAFSSLARVAGYSPLLDQSRSSRVEVSFVLDNWTEWGSTSTSTFAS